MRRSLRLKVSLSLAIPLVLILGTLTAVERARHQAALYSTLSFLASQTGQVIENSLQHAMEMHDMRSLQSMLDTIGQDKTLRAVYLLDTSSRVAFAPDEKGVGQILDNQDAACQPCHRLPAAQRPRSVVVTLADGQRAFRSMMPIENSPQCHRCHDSGQRLNGELLTDISMTSLEAPLAADLRENLLWRGGTILVAVVVANLALTRLVVDRLRGMAGAVARFGRGERPLRLSVNSPDEIGQLAGAFNDMGQRLEAEEAENRALARNMQQLAAQRRQLLERLITAHEDERRGVARDLHDGLGQDLAGLAFGLQGVERAWADDPDQALARLREARAAIAETTDRVYEMILSLRPSLLDDLGLAPALRAQAERTLKDTNTQFELEASDLQRRLPPEIETALFRVFQEALQNVARHAGARRVRLTLSADDDEFRGEIADDGCGFDVAAVHANGHDGRGLGLLGMRERVSQWGGQLDILSQPGAGARLRIRVPLTEAWRDG